MVRTCQVLAAGLAALTVSGSAYAATITKSPDLGAIYSPLSSVGSFVYADSFVAPSTGTVSDLGFWLVGGSSDYRLEVLADTGGSGPDGSSILAQTSVQSGTYGSLTYVDFAPISSTVLTAGQTYWFAASTVGLGGSGLYAVGGHTQNSQQADNGTFWFSNDPSGLVFDGQNLQTEIAFSVGIEAMGAVPLPASAPLFGAALAAFGAFGYGLKRRSAAAAA